MGVTTRQPGGATYRPSVTAPATGARITGIDVVRGLIMVLMAIDHVRVYSGVPAGGPTAGIFFTRWVTHFCAPGFAFLAGTSAFLYGRKLGDASALARHLVTRGLLLVALELTVMHVSWTFGFDFSHLLAGVLWMLGWCMIILAAFVRLRPAVVGWIGVAIMAGQSLMLPIAHALPGALVLWRFLYLGGEVKAGADVAVLYNIVSWIGVMMAGYGFGAIVVRERAVRDRLCIRLGLGATLAFLVIGGILAARHGSGGPPFIFRLLNQSKYRDSQIFLLMTLGPLIALLPWADRTRTVATRILETYGRVPLFYYLLHIPLIHALALIVWKLRDGTVHSDWFAFAPFVEIAPGARWSLPLLYAVFAIAVLLAYPACQWYAGVKARYPASLLRFL